MNRDLAKQFVRQLLLHIWHVRSMHHAAGEFQIGLPASLLVCKAYTAKLDLQPGDAFEIKLGRKQIKLMPVVGGEEE